MLIQSFVILFVVCAGSEKKTLCVEILFVVLIPFLSVYLFISFSLKIFFFLSKDSVERIWEWTPGKFDKKMRSGEDSRMSLIDR